MGSYLTGLIIAGAVVAGMLGLMTFTQEGQIKSLQASVSGLDQDSLFKIATQETKSDERIEAILRLGEVPGDLSVTVPALARMTMDSKEIVRLASAMALKKIGDQGPPHLKEMMESGDEDEISFACSALKELGPAGKMYMPILKEWLRNDDSMDRKRALFALQGIGSDSVEVIDLLVIALDDPDFNCQCMVCRVLEILGPAALPAEQSLLRLLKEGNPSVRSLAATALGAIGPTDQTDTAQVLGENLNAMLQIEKQRTLAGIAHLGPDASSIKDKVRTFMLDEQRQVMPYAAYALWRITGDAKEPLEVLKEMLNGPDYRDDSLELIGKMQEAAAPIVDAVAKQLESPEGFTREIAVVALGNIGPAAAKHEGKIKVLMTDKDVLIRYAAKEALEQIKGNKNSKDASANNIGK